ncbi:MAG: glucuronate isomerase [Deltaproteobacteria bacterium HGW-Deltaproteobacteria-15]|jgi:glucuronate isomerase|nr:MAG: glucuronate isomerase [Deltaproteobacteria bacterium HGW-Deltaproteobacteria-15]
MKPFLSEDFLLHGQAARALYHDFAGDMPILDYHCHLPAQEIAENRKFENLTRIWLNGDHYKWRAMRTNGVPERFITGDADDYEKFQAWAGTVPRTLRNPLYHWTHLELKRYFGITGRLLNPTTAEEIYRTCSEMLHSDDMAARSILRRMNVNAVFTTDDPVDSLEHHVLIRNDRSFPVRVLPAFRPDRALGIESPKSFNGWVDQLEAAADLPIGDFDSLVEALQRRHGFFHEQGCRISDHGIEHPYVHDYTLKEVNAIFRKVRAGRPPAADETHQFRSALLIELARMDFEKGWVQQFHLGALRNVSSRGMNSLGPDTGFDCIGDFEMARGLARFLDTLDRDARLAKTILYPMNPRDNELIAAVIGCFQDGAVRGKIQFGPAWWFNDHKDGMESQINSLSNAGLLSCFTGMVTDSRSFLSYPRHEYFRRVLCNILGNDLEKGEIPDDLDLVGNMVRDICYRNAEQYFGVS